MNIEVNIDRLIIEGIPLSRLQQRQLKGTVEAELGRLLAENGLASHFSQGFAVPTIPVEAMQMSPKITPTQLGQQIAHTVYRGLGS